MRSAVIILAAVCMVAAEAPYHLPRPAPHAPHFGFPSGPAPAPPAPFPQLPLSRPVSQPFAPFPHPAPAPSSGYNYQQPSFGPAFVHPLPQVAPQPIPVYHPPQPAPQPQPLPIAHPQIFPVSYPQPQQIHYPQPQPVPISYPRPQLIPFPQPTYGSPQPQPQPQPQPHPQPQPQPLPNYFYNVPQVPVAPVQTPTFSQPQSIAYQQPISQAQFAASLPLQSQTVTNNGVTSYQADSNQYATAQGTHNGALDETVISRVQNIIRDSEHLSAKNAGYLSLVSGVSLENAQPSIEISSFVQNSPQSSDLIDVRSASSSTAQSSSSTSAASLSPAYEGPTISAGSNQSSDSSASLAFLPHNNPGNSYGVPN